MIKYHTWDIHFMPSLTLEEKFPGKSKAVVFGYLIDKGLLDNKLEHFSQFIIDYSPDKDFVSHLFNTDNIKELEYYYRTFTIDQLIDELNNTRSYAFTISAILAEQDDKREYIISRITNNHTVLLDEMIMKNVKDINTIVEIQRLTVKYFPDWSIFEEDLLIHGCPETWDLVNLESYDSFDLLCFVTRSGKKLIKYLVSKGIKAEDLLLATSNTYIKDIDLNILEYLLNYVKDFSFVSRLTNKVVIDYVNSQI